MTAVTVYRESKKIVSFSCDGHTDYGEEGEDIVCAALSTLTQTAMLGLLQVASIPIKYKIDEKKAYLEVSLPSVLSEAERNNADMILETMFLGIYDLSVEYGKYVKLEVKRNV